MVSVDPGGTSKTCSRCGYEIDRDLNAAINIHNRELEKVGRGTPEVTPVEIGVQLSYRKVQPVREAGSPLR